MSAPDLIKRAETADAEFAAYELIPAQQLDDQVSALLAAQASSTPAAAQEPTPATWPKRHMTLNRLLDNDQRMGDVSDYGESEEYARALLAALNSTTCPLTELKLVRIPALATLMPQLAFVLARLPLLEQLAVVDCDLTDSNVLTLAVAIANHPALRTLSLVGNGAIGDAGMAALVGLMKPQQQQQGLIRLDVGREGSAFTPLSARMVSSALAQPGCTLTRLEWTGLSGVGAGALASSLARSRLTHLALATSQVRGPALERLIPTLTAHPTLQVLSIGDAEDACWTDKDLATLERLIPPSASSDKDQSASSSSSSCASSKSGVLSSLEVCTYSTTLSPAGLLSFARALEQSTQLRTLEVRFLSSALSPSINSAAEDIKQYKEALDAFKKITTRNAQEAAKRRNTASSSVSSSSAPTTDVAVSERSAVPFEQLLMIAAVGFAAWVYLKWM